MSEVLVLNSSYMPVGRVPWRRAFTLICSGRAEVVHEYDDRIVRSAQRVFPMPSVVRFLTRVVNVFSRTAKLNRTNLYARDKGTCQYCGVKVSRKSFTLDHVVPRAQGGKTKWQNLVVACSTCNQRKKDRTPTQAHMKLRTKPVRPRSLPGGNCRAIWEDGMPETWRDFLVTVSYWHADIEE